MKMHPKRHPIQKMTTDSHGVVRFQENIVVEFMRRKLEELGYDLNKIHKECDRATKHDWDQFNQLIGYSVSACPIRDEKTGKRIDNTYTEYLERFHTQKAGDPS